MKRYFNKWLRVIRHSSLYLEEYKYVTNYSHYLGYDISKLNIHSIVLKMAAYREMYEPSELERARQLKKVLYMYS